MNCMIAQSGGPTVAINSSLAGALTAAEKSKAFGKVYGAINGIIGVLNDNIMDLSERSASIPGFTGRLSLTPGMYLGSCRYKIPAGADGEADYKRIFEIFKKYDIGAFFYIGGNDSMDTVDKLSRYADSISSEVRVIGIPKTIDNDLACTDHTPGFGSAAKYVACTVREIAYDAYIYADPSVTIAEIMGRDAGWLTASSALARTAGSPAPDLIYLPEVAFSLDDCIKRTRELLKKKNSVIIAVSEGIRDKDGKYISSSSERLDRFGHAMLSGAGKTLENIMRDELKIKVRSVEINVLQRCAMHMASLTDLKEAGLLGETAVSLALSGKTGLMTVIKRVSSAPYKVQYAETPVSSVANAVRNVPRDFINESGDDVTEKMIEYLKPLIQGEPAVRYADGLPDYLPEEHLF